MGQRLEHLRAKTEENKRKVRAVFEDIKESQCFNLKTIIQLAGVPKNFFHKSHCHGLKKEIMNHENYRNRI